MVQLEHQATVYGPKPFRFQNMWLTHENFLLFMRQVWVEPILGEGLVKWAAKLKRVKLVLKNWNRAVFGRVDLTIKELQKRLIDLEKRIQTSQTRDMEEEFLITKVELDCQEKRKDIKVAKIEKKRQLKEGDQNSKYFMLS